jgi:hypothetical protein
MLADWIRLIFPLTNNLDFSDANSVQYHTPRRMVQSERHGGGNLVNGEFDAGHKAVATQEGRSGSVSQHAVERTDRHCLQATAADIDILFDVCWILSPTQIQKLISQYHVADYEVSEKPESILSQLS